jgi:GTP-binding protein
MMEDERSRFSPSGTGLVLADIPGIIEGASRGKGLGLKFLRHIERTRILVWVIDISSHNAEGDYATLKTELLQYRQEIARRRRIIVLNKIDLVAPEEVLEQQRLLQKMGEEVITVSAISGAGIDGLKEKIREIGRRAEEG